MDAKSRAYWRRIVNAVVWSGSVFIHLEDWLTNCYGSLKSNHPIWIYLKIHPALPFTESQLIPVLVSLLGAFVLCNFGKCPWEYCLSHPARAQTHAFDTRTGTIGPFNGSQTRLFICLSAVWEAETRAWLVKGHLPPIGSLIMCHCRLIVNNKVLLYYWCRREEPSLSSPGLSQLKEY